jgi:hypothetical protein
MTSISRSKLHQKRLFHGNNNFVINSGSHISIEQTKTRRKIKKFDVDLVALSPDSRIQVNLAWHWMAAMIVSLVFIGVVIGTSQYVIDKLIIEYTPILLAIMGVLFLTFTFLFYIFSNRKRFFMTRHAKLPIIEILISNPNKNSYKSFIDGLENEIIISSENRQLNHAQQRAGELKTLRRLSEQGVISKNAYEESKQVLLHFL